MVRSFYEELAAQMLKRFPLNDITLKSLAFLHSGNRESIDVNSGECSYTLYVISNKDRIKRIILRNILTMSLHTRSASGFMYGKSN